jgi:parallel beta-helix repeat protein
VGESGAILDGTGWTTDDPNQGAFRAHNQDIDDVTIRNLVIRNMPRVGIHAYRHQSDRWTIEFNDISSNQRGVAAPSNSLVRHNHIHHNREGGYSAYMSVNTIFEENDVSYNGPEQKMVGTTNVTFRNNFVHHNAGDGIWYDADNTRALIEKNLVADNERDGISFEISADSVIRHNTVLRSGSSGILIATSKNVEIYANTLEDNFRGIQYFVNCGAVGRGGIGHDLANNTAYRNTIKLDERLLGALANVFMAVRSCTEAELAPYLNGSKKLSFRNNKYLVPSSSMKYWFWGPRGTRSWSEWQALGQDTTNEPQ